MEWGIKIGFQVSIYPSVHATIHFIVLTRVWFPGFILANLSFLLIWRRIQDLWSLCRCYKNDSCSILSRKRCSIWGKCGTTMCNLQDKTYDDAILAQFVVHHATDSNRAVRVEWLRCHYTCQIFKCRFAVGQLSLNCWYTPGRQLADSIPTVGQQTFRGALLHFYRVCALQFTIR